MPSREKRVRRRRRSARVLSALIALTALVAAALTLILLNSDPLGADESAPEPAIGRFAASEAATAAPLVLRGGASVAPDSTPEPEASASAEIAAHTENPADAPGAEAATVSEAPADGETSADGETPADSETAADGEAATDGEAPADGEAAGAVSLSERLTPTPMPAEYFLPVYDRALRTPDDAMMIAVTVDDCDDAEAMLQILNVARSYGAKLTLFPTGEALMTQNMTDGFRVCVRDYGYELENHGFSDKAEYRMSDGELAIHIWKQSIAASYALDGDYQQHFFRPYNIHSVTDQRTHFYIRKLNYLGVAGYTHSYRDMSVDELIASLESGKIYQFDMSEASLAAFGPFIDAASRKGYRLVTMNELFGLEENSLSSRLTIDEQVLPEMTGYEPSPYDLKLNDRTRAVYDLQARLIELGYMRGEDAKADGIYGPSTSIAVSAFQAEAGIPATGNATAATIEALETASPAS